MLVLLWSGPALAEPPDDRYIAGYATAILERSSKSRKRCE
jgi:hypothetical protein